ncbi:MAG: hypothetical protein F4Y39_08640 [Gemmatimonadetes bacterium]|nr:hypothetical protein [Gemmatimonadota bacterium]
MPDRNDAANLAKRQKIDWEKIHITVTEDDSPNPQNPYSRLSPEERETALKKLCQSIYLRTLDKRN